jgi:dTDP-4-amino-4,6-dideoxygalactose transaminase
MAQHALENIPIAVPRMPEADALLPYLKRIDAARYYSNFGPLAGEFEARAAAELDIAPDEVTAVASGTAALILALKAAGVRPGTLCLMPAWTFAASAHAAREAGLIPYFTDIAPESWALTPDIARDALRLAPSPVGAVMPVAPFGAPLDYDAWDDFSEEAGIPVVIDAAAAFDTARPGRAPVAISLHATKALGIGEGGLVASRDADLVARARSLSNFGFRGARSAELAGFNAKLSEYGAAVGLAALDAWPFVRTGYVRLAQAYAAALSAIRGVTVMPGFGEDWAGTTCNLLFERHAADAIARDLAAAGIENRHWWSRGCHRQTAFRECPRGELAATEHLADHTLALPFHLKLGPAELNRIVNALSASLTVSAPIAARQAS